MALFMNREDLEAIRPAHVSMGAMRLWRVTHYARMGAILVFAVTLFCVGIIDGLQPLLAAAGGLLALALLLWLGTIVFFFARFSLRTLMLIVLVSAALITLCVTVPVSWVAPPALISAIWFSILLFLVADHDPKISAKNHGCPPKPTKAEQADLEPRA